MYKKLQSHSYDDEKRLNYMGILRDLISDPAFIIYHKDEKGMVFCFFRYNSKAKNSKRWVMGIVSVNDGNSLFNIYGHSH